MALGEALTWAAGQLGALPGVRQSRSLPPNKVAGDLEAVVYASQGAVQFGVPGEMLGLHNVTAELLVPLGELERAYGRLTGLVEPGARALMEDPTLGGAASTFQELTYTLGPELLNGKTYLVLRFTLVGVKIAAAVAEEE